MAMVANMRPTTASMTATFADRMVFVSWNHLEGSPVTVPKVRTCILDSEVNAYSQSLVPLLGDTFKYTYLPYPRVDFRFQWRDMPNQ